MNYHKYYIAPGKFLTQTFYVNITGYLLADDDEVVLEQSLNIRARNVEDAYLVTNLIRNAQLNSLFTKTVVTELNGQSIRTWLADPGEIKSIQDFDQNVNIYSILVVKEAGTHPLTEAWTDEAKDEFTIHATSEQEAHLISVFVCAIPFCGQTRRTFVNGIEHFDERY